MNFNLFKEGNKIEANILYFLSFPQSLVLRGIDLSGITFWAFIGNVKKTAYLFMPIIRVYKAAINNLPTKLMC